ncbi:MAG: hypothetical protein HY841_09000 [Bacteroidetes bacterium]|nr:hypothetical protein [Bacteroidota bacterium]
MKKKNLKELSAKKEQKIIKDFNSGMRRYEIRKKYKITEDRFVSIVKNEINNETEKIIIAHPKLFRFYG